jgi:tetratricopeptide (TPR) repeat protein
MPFQPQEPFDERGRSPDGQLYDRARELMTGGSFDQAAEVFHQSAVAFPHFKTYELLGECYMRLKRFPEAIPYLAAATTLNRGFRAPLLLAETWLELGHHAEATEAVDIALSRNPKYKPALLVRERLQSSSHEDVV